MQSLLCTALALLQVAAPVADPADAKPAAPPNAEAAAEPDAIEAPESDARRDVSRTAAQDDAALEAAEQAWNEGEWFLVRQHLEAAVDTPGRFAATAQRIRARTLLADAVIQDPTLEPALRRTTSKRHLALILEMSPDWSLPGGQYSTELGEAFQEVQQERAAAQHSQCRAEFQSCEADRVRDKAELEEKRSALAELQAAHASQDVQVAYQTARSRVFAAFPAGLGQFYNGDIGLGVTFLTAEAALAAAGIGLIIRRTVTDGCVRDGRGAGGLRCRTNATDEEIGRRRVAEEYVGWILLGTVALDVLVAQLRFKPVRIDAVRTVPRGELEKEGAGARKKKRRPRARMRPRAELTRTRAGLGLHVDF